MIPPHNYLNKLGQAHLNLETARRYPKGQVKLVLLWGFHKALSLNVENNAASGTDVELSLLRLLTLGQNDNMFCPTDFCDQWLQNFIWLIFRVESCHIPHIPRTESLYARKLLLNILGKVFHNSFIGIRDFAPEIGVYRIATVRRGLNVENNAASSTQCNGLI